MKAGTTDKILISKGADYRCKDCQWWKEYGLWCTKLYTHAGDLAKKCIHFRLKK